MSKIFYLKPQENPKKCPFNELKEACEKSYTSKYDEVSLEYLSQVKQINIDKRIECELEWFKAKNYLSFIKELSKHANWFKKQDIATGPSRATSGNSLVLYLLGITDIDPLQYNLIFDPFIRSNRNYLAIDIDICSGKFTEACAYLQKHFDAPRVPEKGCFELKTRGIPGITVIRKIEDEMDVQKYGYQKYSQLNDAFDASVLEELSSLKLKALLYLNFKEIHSLYKSEKPTEFDAFTNVVCMSHIPSKTILHNLKVHNAPTTGGVLAIEYNKMLECGSEKILYREQIIEFLRSVLNEYSAHSDSIRSKMENFNEMTFDQAFFYIWKESYKIENTDDKIIRHIYTTMNYCNRYCLSKSHMISYARLCYQLCALKKFYEYEFMDAIQSTFQKDSLT